MASLGLISPGVCCGRIGDSQSAHQLRHSLTSGSHLISSQRSVQHRSRQRLQVHSALSRKQKEVTVAKLVDGLQNSIAVFGVKFNKISVKDFEAFRRSLPDQSKVVVCKNSLMGIAVDQTEGWESLKDIFQLENAWVFAHEDVLADTVKAYAKFEDDLKEDLPKAERKKVQLTSIRGVMDGRLMERKEALGLEKMPTKLQLLTTIARLIKQVPTNVAISINQVPTKLAYGVKALADGDDNKEAIVGDIFPKADDTPSQ